VANTESKPKCQVVVAVSKRELKTAIFLTLSSEPEIRVVATAANTAELLTYARSFQPEVIILELELKGDPMADVLKKLSEVSPDSKVLTISKPSSCDQILDIPAADNIIRIDDAPETILRSVKSE
jgi:DNA-binding NarL/FixJ family response regulator